MGVRIKKNAPKPVAPQIPKNPTRPRSNDDVLLVGMGTHADLEAQELRKHGVNVTLVKDSFANDQLKVKTRLGEVVYDLTQRDGIDRFAHSLGLPAAQAASIADAIEMGGLDARDELAQIAAVWSAGERGGRIPSRLMISGHHVGYGVWGDKNGSLDWSALKMLTLAMPNAASMVQDIHIAACYSGGEALMGEFHGMFPEAKTIWAYTGSAPGSASGASTHQLRWEKATRGDREALDRAIAAQTRKGENVAVWSKELGYIDGFAPTTLEQLREQIQLREPDVAQFRTGERVVEDPQHGPLREYYSNVQRLLQRRELPAAERADLQGKRDQTIRLLFYGSNVAPKFAEVHGDKIAAGFKAAGMQPPDFAKLPRADALRVIQEFGDKVRAMTPQPKDAAKALDLLEKGLRDLSASVIPQNWI